MSLPRFVLISFVLVLLVLLQFTLRPLLEWRAGVDFLVIGVLLVAARTRPGLAAVVGLGFGLMLDAMQPESLGASALAMTLVGFTASRLKAGFFADNLGLNAIFIFLGKLSFDLISLLAEGRLKGSVLLWQLGVWSPLAAAVTAIVGVMVFALLRPALEARRFG